MNKIVELPLAEPIYSTYHFQGNGAVACINNLSVRNWYLNNAINLTCKRDFLFGYNSPRISIVDSEWLSNPHYEKYWYNMRFLNGYTNMVIKELLDQGYYVCFQGVDDYYIDGKTFYKERHFIHDGLICGYNQEDKTYCMYAYDKKWIYQKFWTPQKSFDAGRKAAAKKGNFGTICGIKAKDEQIELDCRLIIKNIKNYLDSSMEKYPNTEKGDVYGIVVHDYIAMYIDKIYNGDIEHENMDNRILRLIWEHKKVMYERLKKVESTLNLDFETSDEYKHIINEADKMRMIYATYKIKKKENALPLISKKIMYIKNEEAKILADFVLKVEGALS